MQRHGNFLFTLFWGWELKAGEYPGDVPCDVGDTVWHVTKQDGGLHQKEPAQLPQSGWPLAEAGGVDAKIEAPYFSAVPFYVFVHL